VTESLRLTELPLVDAAVVGSASFRDAADVLCASGLSAIAVLDDERRVVGVFTEDDLVAGLFPSYLAELRHTAFTREGIDAVTARAARSAREPVTRHMRPAALLEAASSLLHAAEVFLHCEWGAVAVVEDERFVGMLAQVDFCRRLLQVAEP
jgi:CBS-domain-containing membrane protein